MRTAVVIALSSALCFWTSHAAPVAPWMDMAAPPSSRAAALLAKMNQSEKITMVHGAAGGYVGNVPANDRLSIPSLNLNDGPQGFRDNADPGSTTQWPSGLTVGSSWDPAVLKAWGTAMGQEFIGKGANVQLGPGVCLARVPRNGRNFEYLSGEDPFLGFTLVQPAVQGIQSQGVIANAKHFILNNQETNRNTVSENVDERTIMEMYMAPFAGATKAGVGSMMCSYNRINQVYSCENLATLGVGLKKYVNFTGWVMSDWGATHSTVASAMNGLDQEMPRDSFFGDTLVTAISNGSVPESVLDDKVMRILTQMFTFGLFDRKPSGSLNANVTSAAHNELARELSTKSAILLKNSGVLPLSKSSTTKYAIIGAEAATPTTGGGGSGSVVPYYQSTPLDAIIEAVTGKAPTPRPANCTMFDKTDFYQPGNPSAKATSAQDCCAQCAARTGCNAWAFSVNTCWFKPNTDGRRADPVVTAGTCSPAVLPENIVYNDGSDVDSAVAAAKGADVAIVFGATSSHEGADRTSLSLDDGQDALISAVTAAQPKTVVVVVTPGAILTPWAKDAGAVLSMMMPGQEYGHACADLLFGDVNPSGKLAVTFPNVENEQQFAQDQWPGLPASNPVEANYTEKLLFGYRWYDAHNVEPAFAFGHGLSYTSFAFSDLVLDDLTVHVTVTNTGSVSGSEVAQLYVGFPEASGEPVKQLKGFEKVTLAAGDKTTITFDLGGGAASWGLVTWDVSSKTFVNVKGTFDVWVGASSRDLPLHGTITVQ